MSLPSSPPAPSQRSNAQGKLRAVLRQLLGALFFDLGRCASGRHHLSDRDARRMCCNGWRGSFSWISWNGDLRRVRTWRPITFADPRFPWEPEPAHPAMMLPGPRGVPRFDASYDYRQGELEPEYAYRARLQARLDDLDSAPNGGGWSS